MDQQTVATAAGIAVASIAFFHTITGPDHYLPFIMIAKVRKWPVFKTFLLTLVCGFGHVLSSIILGIIAIFFGKMLTSIQWLEGARGELAAWLLIAFGFVYMIWGIKQSFKKNHSHEHSHPHADNKKITPWILFIIFVLGPCEPLIPLMIAPASKGSVMGVIWVSSIFTIVTLATMLGMVIGSLYGIKKLSFKPIAKYAHAIAGGSIMSCGLAMQFLGL